MITAHMLFSSQLQDCRFLVFQEALNSHINVKNGSPAPVFWWNRTQRQRPPQVLSLPYFVQPGKKLLNMRLVEVPTACREKCNTSKPYTGGAAWKGGLQGLWWVHNTARMGLAPPLFHQSPQIRTQKILGSVDTIWPASSILINKKVK